VVKLHEPLIVLGRKPFRTTSIDGGPFLPGTDSCQSDLSPNLLKRPLFAHYCCQLDPSARLRQKARMAAKVRVEAFSRWTVHREKFSSLPSPARQLFQFRGNDAARIADAVTRPGRHGRQVVKGFCGRLLADHSLSRYQALLPELSRGSQSRYSRGGRGRLGLARNKRRMDRKRRGGPNS
jgi:hypothetical protein